MLQEDEEFIGAFIEAIIYDDLDTIEKMLQNGFDPNINMEDETPLLISIIESSYDKKYEIIEILIKYGANVNVCDYFDNSPFKPLNVAKQNGCERIIKLLKSKGAKCNEHLMVFFARNGNIEKLREYLNDDADINSIDSIGYTPLLASLERGKDKTALFLLKNNADVNIKSENNINAIHCAVLGACSISIVNELIARGCKITEVDKEGKTPLYYACMANRKDIVEILLNHGANINIQTFSGETGLMIASFEGYEELVKYLVSKGAEIDLINYEGNTALKMACYSCFFNIVKFLADKGADISIDGLDGTALSMAKKYRCRKIVNFLKNR